MLNFTLQLYCILSLQNYLMKYGYIPPESSGSAAYRTEEFYKDAVKNFQMMANLPVTGEFIDMNSYVIGWKKGL